MVLGDWWSSKQVEKDANIFNVIAPNEGLSVVRIISFAGCPCPAPLAAPICPSVCAAPLLPPCPPPVCAPWGAPGVPGVVFPSFPISQFPLLWLSLFLFFFFSFFFFLCLAWWFDGFCLFQRLSRGTYVFSLWFGSLFCFYVFFFLFVRVFLFRHLFLTALPSMIEEGRGKEVTIFEDVLFFWTFVVRTFVFVWMCLFLPLPPLPCPPFSAPVWQSVCLCDCLSLRICFSPFLFRTWLVLCASIFLLFGCSGGAGCNVNERILMGALFGLSPSLSCDVIDLFSFWLIIYPYFLFVCFLLFSVLIWPLQSLVCSVLLACLLPFPLFPLSCSIDCTAIRVIWPSISHWYW